MVHDKREQFADETNLSALFFRIVANLCIKTQPTPNAQPSDPLQQKSHRGCTDVLEQPKNSSGEPLAPPETTLSHHQKMTTMRAECHYRLLGALPREQRIVFLMRTRFDMNLATIATILQISDATAKGRMSRAIKNITRELQEHCSLHSAHTEETCEKCEENPTKDLSQLMHHQPPNPLVIEEVNQALCQSDITQMYRQLLRHRPLPHSGEK
jgi:DNA-directed RNA polymerase specialized sigma24 family protein